MTRTSAVREPTVAANSVLVEPAWLRQHLDDPDVRVVEVDVAATAFDEGHIRSAVLWNIYRDLKDAQYRLIDSAATQSLLTRSGIDPATTVVLYGYGPAIGFWLMKLYRHADVRILNCSRQTWRDEGGQWTADAVTPVPTSYPLGDEDTTIRATRDDVERAIADPARMLLDVRTDAEFRGERFWPSGGMEAGGRAGHVPSAVPLPIEGLLDDRGAFPDIDTLRRRFAPVESASPDEVITYCTIGARACTAWLILSYLLGLDGVRVYDGSWAEWGLLPDTPVTAG